MASLRSAARPFLRQCLQPQTRQLTTLNLYNTTRSTITTQPLSTRKPLRPIQSQNKRPLQLLQQQRPHSTPSTPSKQYTYPEITTLSSSTPNPQKILIDVREPSEYSAGYIPTAINIPVKSQPDALLLSPEEFEDRFGFAKPDLSAEVVFYCRSGVRSAAAAELARQGGYGKVGEYRGSWIDWEGKGGEVAKP